MCVCVCVVVRHEETLLQQRRNGLLQEGQAEGRPQEPHDRWVLLGHASKIWLEQKPAADFCGIGWGPLS